jgi:hypothetical protein
MVQYDLHHLTQPNDQVVGGPIQDDEALLLYAIIRVCMIKNIVEIGGLDGYSAANFLSAISDCEGKLFTIDLNSVIQKASNHFVIQKDAGTVSPTDLLNTKIDMLFFDCHHYQAQMEFYDNMTENKLIDDDTMIVLHDTNLHPTKSCAWAYRIEEGWIHQPVERIMVNELVTNYGYHVVNFHTKMEKHKENLPFRHGISVLSKYKVLPLR